MQACKSDHESRARRRQAISLDSRWIEDQQLQHLHQFFTFSAPTQNEFSQPMGYDYNSFVTSEIGSLLGYFPA
jgi:hypothetical protein